MNTSWPRSLSSRTASLTIVYPPVMGLLSVTVGLSIAMVGNALIGLACAGALLIVGRRPAVVPE